MRLRDTLGMAGRAALGKAGVLPVLGVAACLFCLSFAATAWANVRQEQQAPCELQVTAGQSKLTASALEQLEQVPGVVAISPVVQLEAQLSVGDYAADLPITGLRADYVVRPLKQGALFAGRGAMPYLVLNEVACKQFQKSTVDFTDKEPNIPWLGIGLILKLDDTNSLPARVCGILAKESDDELPTVLMDYESAQALLRSMDQPADPQQVFVRVRDSGTAQPVQEAIAKLGFNVALPQEGKQAAWQAQQKEATYLILLGLLSLCLAIGQMRAARRLTHCQQRELWSALDRLGMRQSTRRGILRGQTLLVACYGWAVGSLSLAIPALLQPEVIQGTCFALPVPWWAGLGCGGIAAAAFFLASQIGHRAKARNE